MLLGLSGLVIVVLRESDVRDDLTCIALLLFDFLLQLNFFALYLQYNQLFLLYLLLMQF